MSFYSISQCDKSLDFHSRAVWPRALPAYCWQRVLLTGFERSDEMALDLSEIRKCSWLEAVLACYPNLGLSELARLSQALQTAHPALAAEYSEGLFAEYGFRWCERLQDTLRVLVAAPREFQDWVDEKKLGARDLAALLALESLAEFTPFLNALTRIPISKSAAVQALECGVELFLMGHPLNDILPTDDNAEAYLRRLESWRKPQATQRDELWRQTVTEFPWPAQVQGQWQRFGDQAGLEIKIRTTSPQDLSKKLERLSSVREAWSCKTS